MPPKIDIITIGVADPTRARAFYENGFGYAVQAECSGALTLRHAGNASRLSLRSWDAVAYDAGVDAHSSGFRGFTLSYIMDSAQTVDAVLARAERHGGKVSKPPRNVPWGYSAYVTDPSGHLWKIASSRRRPLIARKGSSAVNGDAVDSRDVPITLGVADMAHTKKFYKDGIGLLLKKEYRKFVMFDGQPGTSDLGMYRREALADDAAVQAEGSGFRGFTITHEVDSAEQVDALLARATRAGGTNTKSPLATDRAGYSGYFADPDGTLWEIASLN